jgi:hypothetical protein
MSVLKTRLPCLLLLLLGSGCFFVPKSWADNATANLSVTATVPPSVNVDTTPVNNIPYDASTGSNVSSNITLTASPGTTLTILISQGQNPGTGSSNDNPVRRMSDGQGNFFDYELSNDGSFNDDWGNAGQTGVTLTGTGFQQNVPFYLRISSGQNAKAGYYTDTLLVTTLY